MSDIFNAQTIISWLLTTGLSIAGITLGGFIAYFIYRSLMRRVVRVFIKQTYEVRDGEAFEKRAGTITGVFNGAGKALIGLVALMMILSELGLNIGPLLAGAGIAGLAFGFGAQNLVKDVISGLFILLDDEFREGDVAKVAGISGLVEDVNLRRTVLRDLDGTQHFIPNGEITVASNLSKFWSRVNLDVPVSYETDLDRATEVLNGVGRSLVEDATFGPMLKTPPQVIGVDDFGESAIVLKMLGDTQPLKQWDVTRELRKRIKRAFDKEEIEIPYPHRVVVQK